jgi:glycosyltransferase involved in cell wall biosynthesis
MKISILVPAYNERSTIRAVLAKVRALPCDKEIIVVDDGSTDGTREILMSMQDGDVSIVLQEINRGKGAAIRRGLREVSGDYVVFQDADLELDPSDILRLAERAAKGAPVVYGSRFLIPQPMPLVSALANRFLTLLTNVLYGGRITDMETCYKFCAVDVLKGLDLRSSGFELEPEITCKILRKGYRIEEVPVAYRPRREGKKIGWKDGVLAVWYLLRYRIAA